HRGTRGPCLGAAGGVGVPFRPAQDRSGQRRPGRRRHRRTPSALTGTASLVYAGIWPVFWHSLRNCDSGTPMNDSKPPAAAKAPAPPKGPTPEARGLILDRLYKVIESRRNGDPAVSHTAKLFQKGTRKIAQKVGEEAVEAVIEAVRGKRDRLI